MVCPTCGERDCIHDIKMGPAIPVALVCNLIPETDDPTDPLCNTCAGTMCYKVEGGSQEVETTPDNDWDQTVTNQTAEFPQALTGGAIVTFTMDHLTPPGGGVLAGFSFVAITPAPVDTFRLTWDHALVGQFAVVLDAVDVGPTFNIVPAPDSVNPAFGPGGTHQLVWNDITGINQIDFQIDATVPGADVIQFSIDESVPLTSIATVEGDTIEVMLVCNVCNDPPTTRYVDMSTGEEITDPDIINSLYNCDIDVTEEEVCVIVDDETFTCIKRTFYASDPVDVFIGPNGSIVNPDSWVPGICDFETVIGYVFDCLRFDNNLPINSNATFTDAPIGTNEIIFEAADVALLVREEIVKAQRVQSQEELHGDPITPIVIITDSGEIYEFNPDALQSGTGSTLVIDEAGIIAWGINQTDLVTEMRYSVFDNCDCKAVEVLQWIKDSDEVYLLDVFDITYDQATGQKVSLLDEDRLLDFLTLGPFAGPCPETLQVIEVNPLCCNDDLVEGSNEIAQQRLAWLDASDETLMRDGGAPITGTTGEDVDEVWDKLQPGIAPSFVVPANVAPGDDDPPTAPTFVEDGLNELSVLNFASGDRDRLRLDTGNPPSGPFTLFYLVSASDLVLASHACILSVGPNNSDGDAYQGDDGAWQLSRDGTEPAFIFRIGGPLSAVPGTDPIMIVQTGPYSAEDNPSDGPNPTGALGLERAIATEAEFFNGQFHLITVSYDDVNQILSAYFDGELRLQMDMSTMVPAFAVGSDYFRLFGNRAGSSFLSGQLAEMFFADSFLTPEETAEVNSYLICKWGIDPSIVAGGLGDLELDAPGSYNVPTPFVQIVRADGTTIYRNTLNGQEFTLPPTPGLALCEDPTIESVELQKFDWMKQLCDRIDTLVGLDLYTFNNADEEVRKVNALTGDILDSHLPGGAINWGAGSVFNPNGGATGHYYLYDTTAGEWHRYDAGNIASGGVNLGAFGGDPITTQLTFGAYDPTTDRAYVGTQSTDRYEIDFNTLTVTALPAFNGHTGIPSTLSITETGLHYMTAILGSNTILHTVDDVATGACTAAGFFADLILNGADYDQDTLSGFYGVSGAAQKLYHWTELDGSDLEEVFDAAPTGTLAVGQAVFETERVEFQRVYHKDLISGEITSQDHDLEGVAYEVQGTVEHCPVEVESSIETTCDDPLHVQQCVETWSQRLCDVGFLEVLGEDQVFVEIAPQAGINQALQFVGFSGGEGPVTGVVEAVFPVEPDVQYDYIAGHGGAGTCPGGPATILVEIIDDGGAGAVLASQTLQYVGGVDPAGVDLGPTVMQFTSTTGNVMVRVSDQTPLTNICDAIFYWYDFQTTDTVSTEFQRVFHKNLHTDTITAQDWDFRGNLYTLYGSIEPCRIDHEVLMLCDTDAEGCQTPFLRHFFRMDDGVLITRDTYMDGNADYTVMGSVLPCYDVPCQETVEAHLIDLGSGETWTPASLPVDHVVTGLSMNVQVEAADSSVTDADGNVVTNIPAGQSMSWNASADGNTLTPPQSISAGTGGRIMLNLTMRDETI